MGSSIEDHRLRVFENRTRQQGSGEDCILRSFMICTSHQILLGW